MRQYRTGVYTKTDLKVHLIWISKYRKKILKGQIVIRTRDLLRQIAMEYEINIIAEDHIHMFVSYRPTQSISSRVLLNEFSYLKKIFLGKHLWTRGYMAVSSGNITDEMIKEYIDQQDGEPVVDDSRFRIDSI